MTPAWMDPHATTDITIHCTATPEGRPNTAAEISAWDIQRFGQVSYHYVYELDGTEHQTLRHDQRGAHTGGHNTGNLGMTYVGGTETLAAGGKPKDTRTPAQKAAMERRLKILTAEIPTIRRIRGHHDWPAVNKACPSFNVQTWLGEISLARYFPGAAVVPTAMQNAKPTLERGDTGPEVETLQRKLGMQLQGSQWGNFGPMTETAVIAFQKSKGLKPDGQVGTATRGALGL